MKKTFRIFGLFMISATLMTCDALEEADDVTFHAEMEMVFEADAGTGETTHNDVRILNLADNDEIDKHINKIKDIKITNITYWISNYSSEDPCTGSSVLMNGGTLSFSASDTDIPLFLGNYAAAAAAVNLQTTTAETDLSFDPDDFHDAAEVLVDDKQLKVYTNATLSCAPVAFHVNVRFYLEVTANALD